MPPLHKGTLDCFLTATFCTAFERHVGLGALQSKEYEQPFSTSGPSGVLGIMGSDLWENTNKELYQRQRFQHLNTLFGASRGSVDGMACSVPVADPAHPWMARATHG